MAFAKPNLSRVWAFTAPPSNVVDPDVTTPGKWDSGWMVEIPPFEHFNYLQQSFSGGLAHLNQQGVMVWDALTEYDITGLAKGSDGNVYRSLVATNMGNDPISSPTQWELVTIIGRWNINATYNIGDVVLTTIGEMYRSLVNGNTGNNPTTSPNHWDSAAPVQDSVPVGSMMYHASSTPPGQGWFVCEGSAISRTIYAELFSVIGTTWGAGNGSTTFNLPDARGRFMRGFDLGVGRDPGRVFGTAQNHAFTEHTHGYERYGQFLTRLTGGDGNFWEDLAVGSNTTGASQGSGPETRPINVTGLVIIKF